MWVHIKKGEHVQQTDIDAAKQDFLNALEHAYRAYSYLNDSIPAEQLFVNRREVTVGRFVFQKPEHAESMRVELGWAFFTRFEASLEAFTTRLGIKLKCSMVEYLREKGRQIPERYVDGLQLYRELRNTLHHGDGDPSLLNNEPKHLRIGESREPHLFEQEVRDFYELFRWLADELVATCQAP